MTAAAGLTRALGAVRDHVGLTVAALSLVTFVSASVCVRATMPAGAVAQEARATPAEEARASLPGRLASRRASYDTVTEDALALLEANAWCDARGTTVLTFEDDAYRLVRGGEEGWVGFAVTAAERRPSADGSAQVTTLCVETAADAHIATLEVPRAPQAPTLRCAGIAGDAVLSPAPELREIALDGPPDAVLEPHGATVEGVRRALAAWACTWRPTATAASWGGTVTEDHARRECLVPFRLDDRQATAVVVSVSMDDGTLEVREGTA